MRALENHFLPNSWSPKNKDFDLDVELYAFIDPKGIKTAEIQRALPNM
jgi:hypothetical protein